MESSKRAKTEELDSDTAQPPPLVSSPHTSLESGEVPPLKATNAAAHGAGSGAAASAAQEKDAKRNRDITAELEEGDDDRPSPSPAVTSAVVCICNMFAEDQTVLIDLHKFASLFETKTNNGRGITGVSYGDIHKGFQKKAAKQFAHQAQLRLSLDGAENVVVKMFKTGQMQTCGCPSIETSTKAVRMVVQALNDLRGVGGGEGLLRWSGIGGGAETPVATLTPDKLEVKVVNTNCSFDGGFLEKGYGVNLEKLVQLLSKPAVSQEVERVEFDPHSHYAGAKVYFRPSQKHDSGAGRRSVFVGVFPSSKCVITGAASNAVAAEAYEFMSKFLVNSYLQLRVRMSPVSLLSRKTNKRRRKASPPRALPSSSPSSFPAPPPSSSSSSSKAAASLASSSSHSKATFPTSISASTNLEIQLQLPDGKQAVTLRRAVGASETLADLRRWVTAEAQKLEVWPDWVRSLAFVGDGDRIVSADVEQFTMAQTIRPQVKMAQLEMAQAAEALLAGLRA